MSSKMPSSFIPHWATESPNLPSFEVLDTRSAQGRADARPKTVTLRDLVLMHGHLCDGVLRGMYAMRALMDVAFGSAPTDRTDLLVVSKNSPCLGDVAVYLTGGRMRFGTHRIDASLGVGFQIQRLSTGEAWEVREEPGFFPSLIGAWEAALLSDDLPARDKAELIAINEATQWNWLRSTLLPSSPADHYAARRLESFTPPAAVFDGRRTDVVNRAVAGPEAFRSPYELGLDATEQTLDPEDMWVRRYLAGPDAS